MSARRWTLGGTQLVAIGLCTMAAGTLGVVILTVVAVPFARRLGGASPACLFDACSPVEVFRALVAAYLLVTIAGIGITLVGGRLRKMTRRAELKGEQL